MPVDRTADLQACRRLMRGGSKSFFAASLLLPARVRGPATALYAFCRLADDAIDLGSDPHAAMAELKRRLDTLYAGRPADIDADRALAPVVREFDIPRALLDALLDGFLWDAQSRRHETLADLLDYAARVAGSVGAMMALVMGARSPQALARACELGVAMQLTNIARDVGEDAANGRLYLPRAWLQQSGIDADAWLRAPVFDQRLGGVVQRLLAEADALYRRSEAGIAELPRDCRAAIRAARLVYAEIGEKLQRSGLDSVNRRVVVSRQRKLALMARATGAALRPGRPASRPARADGAQSRAGQPGEQGEHGQQGALAAVQYLVDAAQRSSLPARAVQSRPVGERVVWLIDLFERQARRQGESRLPG